MFLLLPRRLEWQERFSHSIATCLKRRNEVITDQMEKNNLLMAHSKRMARICEIYLVLWKGQREGSEWIREEPSVGQWRGGGMQGSG